MRGGMAAGGGPWPTRQHALQGPGRPPLTLLPPSPRPAGRRYVAVRAEEAAAPAAAPKKPEVGPKRGSTVGAAAAAAPRAQDAGAPTDHSRLHGTAAGHSAIGGAAAAPWPACLPATT